MKNPGSHSAELGNTLRLLRNQRNLSGIALANKAQVSQSTVSKIERGQFIPKLATLKRLVDVLEASPEEAFHLANLVRRASGEVHETVSFDFDGLLSMLRGAREVRVFSGNLLPAIVQSAETARIMADLFKDPDGDDVSAELFAQHFVYWRQKMKAELFDPRRRFCLLMGEEALLRPIHQNSHEAMNRQISALREYMNLSNVSVRIVGLKNNAYINVPPFTIYDSSSVAVDTLTSAEVIDDPGMIERHRRYFDQIWNQSVDEDESLRMIDAVLADVVDLTSVERSIQAPS